MVAWEPVQCQGDDDSDCEILFCKVCIYEHNDGVCTRCKNTFPKKPMKLNKIVMSLFKEQ